MQCDLSRTYIVEPVPSNTLPSFKKVKEISSSVTLITLNKKFNDILKMLTELGNSEVLLSAVTGTVVNETKKQDVAFLSMLLGTLGASLIGKLSSGKQMGSSVVTGVSSVREGIIGKNTEKRYLLKL